MLLDNMNLTNFRILWNKTYFQKGILRAYIEEHNFQLNQRNNYKEGKRK